jgi:hypothetical protein
MVKHTIFEKIMCIVALASLVATWVIIFFIVFDSCNKL